MKVHIYVGLVALALNVCASGQGTSPSVPVTVVNAPSRPIPTVAQGTTAIAGTVSISGTPNVTANVTNPITLAPSTSVNVANAVNSGGTPVPLIVRTASSSEAYPILLQLCRVTPSSASLCGTTAATNGTSTTFPTTTPDGLPVKFVDIDNFNSECNFPSNATSQEVEVDFWFQGNLAEYAFPVPSVNNVHAMTNERTHIYADPGSNISISQNYAIGLAVGCAVTLSGHLVPQ